MGVVVDVGGETVITGTGVGKTDIGTDVKVGGITVPFSQAARKTRRTIPKKLYRNIFLVIENLPL